MNLRKIRKDRGLTQVQLAQMVHVDQTAISQWERGITQPRLKNCLQLAKILKCNVEDICTGTTEALHCRVEDIFTETKGA